MRSRIWWSAWVLFALSVMVVVSSAVEVVTRTDPGGLSNPVFAAHGGLLTTHALAAGLALALAPFQLVPRLQHVPAVHRSLGWAYVGSATIGGVTGVAMGPLSLGGASATVGFATFGGLWVVSTWLGVFAIGQTHRQGGRVLHRRLMLVSVAVAFSAVTFRIGQAFLVSAGLEEAAVWDVMAWACWIPNVVFVEWLSRRHSRSRVSHASQTAGGGRAISGVEGESLASRWPVGSGGRESWHGPDRR